MHALQSIPGAREWLLVSVQALHPFYTRKDRVVATWMTRDDRAVPRLLQLKAMKPVVGLCAQPAKPVPGGVALPFPSLDSGRKGRATTQSSFDLNRSSTAC